MVPSSNMLPKKTTGGGKKCQFCESTFSTYIARRNHKRKVKACRVKRDAAVGIRATEVPVDSKPVADLPLHLLEDGWRKYKEPQLLLQPEDRRDPLVCDGSSSCHRGRFYWGVFREERSRG